MAGTIRSGEYLPQQGDWRTVNPQEYYPNFPDIPQGYENWTDYIKAVIDANERGEEGPRPYNVYGGDAIGDPSVGPRQWLQHSLGYGQLAPFLDQSDPKIQQFLDNMYYAGSSHDSMNIFGDQFFNALMGLGAFVGGSAALGAFAPAAAGGVAGGEGLELLLGGAASDALTGAGGAGAIDLTSLATPVGLTGGSAAGGMAGPAAGGGGGLLGGLGGAAAGGAGGLLGELAPYAAIAGPVVSAGTSLLGGVLAGNAAKEAAETQAGAADRANATLTDLYNQQRTDMLPYLGAGYAALGQLAGLADQPLTSGPYTPTPTMDPAGYKFDPAAYAFTPPSGQEVLNQDPGYAFRLSEGMKALNAQSAAKGGLISGGALKGAQRFGQDLASQEYGNAYNRSLAQNQLGYERGLQGNQLGYQRAYQQNADEQARGLQGYQTNLGTQMGLRNQQWNELAGLAGIGQTAGQQQAGLTSNLGTQLANNITSAGAAQAAGQVGASNALTQGLGGVGNAANSYLQYSMLQDLLRARR